MVTNVSSVPKNEMRRIAISQPTSNQSSQKRNECATRGPSISAADVLNIAAPTSTECSPTTAEVQLSIGRCPSVRQSVCLLYLLH